ncbi:hypothetical protein [Paractinoplanes rishiriensis]|uniref:Uncharacterized protein n=1 Tax=Paractinoplanes rishiriensis TaxID=1050105 RepID=A0A919K655_9ACTN|nr:hypothetical protein [Actinoplanes rishiriensis]GIE97331.1 hypothetical protein Ari01nite_47960 [Actinoplanes rishiriensis]
MDSIDEVLATADRAWRAHGVSPADRTALAADLRLDLDAAAADGVTPESLLGTDVPAFARRLADEAGVHREPPDYRRLLGEALIAVALGGVAGAVVLKLMLPLFDFMTLGPGGEDWPVQVALGIYYGVPAVVVVAVALTTLYFRLRDMPRIGATIRAMAVLVPLAGILITPVTMAFAWTTDYSQASYVIFAEAFIVLAALAGATVLARRWSLRDSRPRVGV